MNISSVFFGEIQADLTEEITEGRRWVVYQVSVTMFTKFQFVNQIEQFYITPLHLPDILTLWMSTKQYLPH